ncbi:hypothetical protein [Paenibacillus cellulositrophicus]|uniref:hypothetical protein n=1 Tax=Paenibacillus cellulositrophicus TaxID=562959 RepID=UPI001266FED7|nr:hypothetical protein [Paenibacillus cellulositrophicus]
MWPEHFPEGCPINAEGKSVEVFRLVDNNPPLESDFIALSQQGRKVRGDACQACGLSVFELYDDAVQQNEVLAGSIYFQRNNLPKKRIAVGRTNPEYGMVRNTPVQERTSHLTYWIFKDKDVTDHFSVI